MYKGLTIMGREMVHRTFMKLYYKKIRNKG